MRSEECITRHNLILFNGLVDEDTFCSDLTSSSSCIAVGSQSWDPSGWRISEQFKERWAVLFELTIGMIGSDFRLLAPTLL